MPWRLLTRCCAALAILVPMLATPSIGLGQIHDPAWEIGAGGRLYDRWYAELMLPEPGGTHPLYPPNGPASGAETWRCVTCHGWNYAGSALLPDTDLRPLRGADPQVVTRAVRSASHGYGPLLPDAAVDRIAAFLVRGQIDPPYPIDPLTGAVEGGNWVNGALLYTKICANCHGMDGAHLMLPSGGTVAAAARLDPWRLLHKIRFGEPDTGMPALLLLAPQDQTDILAFLQRYRTP